MLCRDVAVLAVSTPCAVAGNLLDTRVYCAPSLYWRRWLEQYQMWERINLASHRAAATNSDDAGLAALLTYEKLGVAVRGAICVESWRNHVLPRLAVSCVSRATTALPCVQDGCCVWHACSIDARSRWAQSSERPALTFSHLSTASRFISLSLSLSLSLCIPPVAMSL